MKTAAILLVFAIWISLGNGQEPSNPPNTPINEPTPYSVVSRGANQRVWEHVEFENHDGKQVPHVHRVTELATGMHYLKDGAWAESSENIQILPQGGAAATEGQHQVYFPGDIYNGVIEMVTPDGLHLKSRPIGVSYFDGQNTVLIGELKSSIGQLISSNQIIYPDAFTDFKADLVCTYRRSGFESDLVLREQPLGPESYNLNPQTTRMELLTEFFDTPEPGQKSEAPDSVDGLADTTLAFGQMQMVQGKAFSVEAESQQISSVRKPRISVYKAWVQVEGRSILVEQVPFQKMNEELQTLPVATGLAASKKNSSVLHKVAAKRILPPARLVQKAGTNLMQLASVDLHNKRGVVLDYTAINIDTNNFTFCGGDTYYINNGYHFGGVTTIEGGAVIKANYNGTVNIDSGGTVVCKTAPYRPAVFTSMNDNSIGETISGSSGTPSASDISNVMNFRIANVFLHDMRFSYASQVFEALSPLQTWLFENCQFFEVNVMGYGYNVWLRNVLIAGSNGDGAQFFISGNCKVRAEHVTADNIADNGGYLFSTFSGTSVSLTNCVVTRQELVDPTGSPTVSTQNVICVPSVTGVFQAIGAGNYYLGTNIYRNVGTTNLDPTVLADIRTRTTYPPIIYTNTTIAGGSFSPQAQRDIDTPDLGYHYDPFDYIFNGVSSSTNMTFAAGTAVGWHEYGIYGLSLPDDTIIAFNGTASAPCYYSRFNTVQEGPTGNWTHQGNYGIAAIGYDSSYNHAIQINATFLRFTQFGGQNPFRDYTICLQFRGNHCEFYGPGEGGYGMKLYLTNCLFDRCYVGVQAGGSSDAALVMRNCTMRGSFMITARWSGSTWPVWIQNCAFDNVSLTSVDDPSGGDTNITYCNYNAFVTNTTRLPMSGANDRFVLTTPGYDWQTGPLGYFYEPTNSVLTNNGSMTADLLRLYHFTTQTNQIKETNSVVDIGYHYVATDVNGNPIDSNGNGTADYLEDINGSGQPLSITLISPADNSFIAEPANINIQTAIFDWGGTVTNVEFFGSSIKIASTTNTPFQFTWPLVAVGTYSLSATARDSTGHSATSPSIAVAVTNLCSY